MRISALYRTCTSQFSTNNCFLYQEIQLGAVRTTTAVLFCSLFDVKILPLKETISEKKSQNGCFNN